MFKKSMTIKGFDDKLGQIWFFFFCFFFFFFFFFLWCFLIRLGLAYLKM